ncbi:MAG: helicase C-terminal domain-containing protein, partial [Thermofilum sp.]
HEAPCEKGVKDYQCSRRCPYDVQKSRALAAQLAVLNTAIFLNEANYVGGFSGNKHWIVFDEADLLEAEIMGFIEVSISSKLIDRLGLEPPSRKTVEEAWIKWVDKEAIPKVSERVKELEDGRDWKTISLEELRELQELTRVKAKLEFFRREIEATMWANCTEDTDNGPWVWKPVFIDRYAGSRLWKHGSRFLLMSATILEPKQFCRSLGIPPEEAEYIELPSTFPKENRPVYFVPVADMTHKQKNAEWPRLVESLDKVLDLHPYDKALVHTVSYALANYIYEHSKHQWRMVKYNGSKEKSWLLEHYRKSEQPLVIVAPSMDRGVDLPGDLLRVVVIAKVPYRDLSDEQVRKRLYGARDGRAWYSIDAVRTIVQMSGRGVRHEKDWAITYILDAQFGRLYKEWKKAFPGWWREALKTTTLKMLKEV